MLQPRNVPLLLPPAPEDIEARGPTPKTISNCLSALSIAIFATIAISLILCLPIWGGIRVSILSFLSWFFPSILIIVLLGLHRSARFIGRRDANGSALFSSFLFALGFFAASAALSYLHYMLYRKPSDMLWWGDIPNFIGYVFLTDGIFRYPLVRGYRRECLRFLLDAMITMTALVLIAWYFQVWSPIIAQAFIFNSLDSRLVIDTLLSLAEVCLVACIFFMLQQAIQKRLKPERNTLIVMLFGIVCFLISSRLRINNAVLNWVSIEVVITGLRCMGVTLLGFSGLFVGLYGVTHRAMITKPEKHHHKPVPNLWLTLAPFVFVLPIVWFAFYRGIIKGMNGLETGFLIGCGVLIALLFLRQYLMLRENDRLYRSLQDAYKQLEEKNQEVREQMSRIERTNLELHAVQRVLIENNQDLNETKKQLEELVVTDAMTQIPNHRAFQERVRLELSRAIRYRYPITLLMMDVDNFKHYNDTYGHPEGDKVLKMIAVILRDTVREGDFVARYGGEEFVAILPQTNALTGRIVGERIRSNIENHIFEHCNMTVSIGLAEFDRDEVDVVDLIKLADDALYRAKNSGKNRIISAHTATLPQIMAS